MVDDWFTASSAILASSKWIGADLTQSGAPDKRFCRCMWEIVEQRGWILLPRSMSGLTWQAERGYERWKRGIPSSSYWFTIIYDETEEFALLSNLTASLNCHEPRGGWQYLYTWGVTPLLHLRCTNNFLSHSPLFVHLNPVHLADSY